MQLTHKERELASIGASIATGCQLCIDVHVREARKVGVTEDAIERAVSNALATRDRANRVMERHTFRALGKRLLGLGSEEEEEEQQQRNATDDGQMATRVDELVKIASAHAANCEEVLQRHVALARELGVTDQEIEVVVRLSKFIKGKADSLCCKWI